MQKHKEVIIFTAGLMKDPRLLIEYMYQKQIEVLCEFSSIDAYLFKSVDTEATVPLPDNYLHNNHINYYDHNGGDRNERSRDKSPIYYTSRLYIFWYLEEMPVCNIESQQNTNTNYLSVPSGSAILLSESQRDY